MNEKIINLLLKVGKLKTIKRSGWVREGMPDPESVAEHTFRLCFLIILLGEKLDIDIDKVLKMAVLHDIEEIETEDPVTQRGATDVGKHNHFQEKEIIKRLFSGIYNSEKLYNLWEEHLSEDNAGSGRDANILYQLGKIATVWQAFEYEQTGTNSNKMNEWWDNAKAHVSDPFLLDLLSNFERRRIKNG